jgi:hypothetical protein
MCLCLFQNETFWLPRLDLNKKIHVKKRLLLLLLLLLAASSMGWWNYRVTVRRLFAVDVASCGLSISFSLVVDMHEIFNRRKEHMHRNASAYPTLIRAASITGETKKKKYLVIDL